MIHKKELSSNKTDVESITYCDERRIVQIAHKNGAVEEFHGVEYDTFYGLPSGPSASFAVRKKLWGKHAYRVATRAALFKSAQEQLIEDATTAIQAQKAESEKVWQEHFSIQPPPSSSVSRVLRHGSTKKKLVLVAQDPSTTTSS
ncbi:MAG TPA: hypothetical protein VN418_07630 [Gammaproteobacteria bacterium]|nr:hypothetical protein [Gammaproteobacteria bacterium]